MGFLNVFYFAILVFFSNLVYKFGVADDNKLQYWNETKSTKLNEKNTKTLFPIDAADLLECSKRNGYILLDKTSQITKNATHKGKIFSLENIYLSSHFFGIMESISGTTGNFVSDAISGLQINRVLEALKETRIQIYLGNFQDSPNLMNRKISSINLSCIYGNYLPKLNFYHANNFCEYTQGIENNNYLLLSEDHICEYNYSEKYIYGNKMKYFNVFASLNIPIIRNKDFDQQFFSLFNNQNIYNDHLIQLNRYLLLSNELGLSFFINFGIGFFGKLESEKYYLLIKIVPPNTFWIKDEYYEKSQENTKENKIINSKSCIKYENGAKFLEKNTISVIETESNNHHQVIHPNSITYLNISLNEIIKCLGKCLTSIYTKSDGKTPPIVKIFDKENNEFRNMEITENNETNMKEFKYLYKFISKYKLFSTTNIMIINENTSKIYIYYKISCKDDHIQINNLFSYTLNSLKNALQYNKGLEVSFFSTKLANYSNGGIALIILVILILVSTPILGIFALIIKLIIKKYDNSRINHLKIPLTNKINTKFENTLQVSKHLKYNFGEDYSIQNSEIPLRLKKDFLSPLSSPVSSLANMNGHLYNQLQSPEQLELYTAISNNNISESAQFNTNTCSSPSTIKSITFKH